MAWIIQRLVDVADFFYDIGLEVSGWIWPFWEAATFFFSLNTLFANLAWDFVDFDEWLEWAADEIGDILSWSNIRSLIRGWLDGIEDALEWFGRWWVWVGQEIDDWWSSTLDDVKGWIAAAVSPFDDLLTAWNDFWDNLWPDIVNKLSTLKADWDNFWTVLLPTLVDFTWLETWWNARLTDIQELINTAIQELAPFWEGWQEIRDQVYEFFADPLEWLWSRFTDWFLGPEV